MKSLLIAIAVPLLISGTVQLFAQQTPDTRNVWTGGQRGHLVFGDLTPLSNQKTFNVVVIPHVEKMGAAEQPDSVYIATRVSEWNAEKPGKGDRWLDSWKRAQVNFKSAFIAGMNAKLAKATVNIKPDDSWADYSFIVSTRQLLEFWNKIYVILDVQVVMTAEPENEVAFIRCPVNNSALGGAYFTSEFEKAYYSAGYLLGKYLRKAIY